MTSQLIFSRLNEFNLAVLAHRRSHSLSLLYASAVRRSVRLCNSSPLGTQYSESNFYTWKGALNGIFKYDVVQILMGVNLAIAVFEIRWRRFFYAFAKLALLIYKYIDYLCLLGI